MSEVEIFRKSLMDKFEEIKGTSTRLHELFFFDGVLAVIENHQVDKKIKEIENIDEDH